MDDPFDDPPQLAELIPDASPEGKPKDEVMCILIPGFQRSKVELPLVSMFIHPKDS